MTVCVFLGPSLPTAEARALLPEAVLLPPVRRGAVIEAVETHNPATLAIIDGYFEQVPAVWHKEILWALDRGIAVWGAASMGALRAAELGQFGMTGHGVVAEAYRRGRWDPFPDPFEDDDEVAVLHGPEGADHLSTVAMVDVRATLVAATETGGLTEDEAVAIAAAAKAVFYKDRDWRAVLAAAHAVGAGTRLAAAAPEGPVPQKRHDAAGLLTHLATDPSSPLPPPFRFERTLLWAISGAGDEG
ncbi:MAG: TfuA-like protein [Pseudomonadota bacterium]